MRSIIAILASATVLLVGSGLYLSLGIAPAQTEAWGMHLPPQSGILRLIERADRIGHVCFALAPFLGLASGLAIRSWNLTKTHHRKS